jgi:hypothetical protein
MFHYASCCYWADALDDNGLLALVGGYVIGYDGVFKLDKIGLFAAYTPARRVSMCP